MTKSSRALRRVEKHSQFHCAEDEREEVKKRKANTIRGGIMSKWIRNRLQENFFIRKIGEKVWLLLLFFDSYRS